MSKRLTPRVLEYLNAYVENRTYEAAGKVLGVSRQSVEQKVKQFLKLCVNCDEHRELYDKVVIVKSRLSHVGESCSFCLRPMTKYTYGGKGMCRSCYAYTRSSMRMLPLFIRSKVTSCKNCSHPFEEKGKFKKRALSLCARCFAKTDGPKNTQKRYHARNKELFLKRSRKYYQTHKKQIMEKHKIWEKANPDKTRLYQRNSYYKRKANKLKALQQRDYYKLLIDK